MEEGISYQFELRASLTGASDGITVIVLSTPAKAEPLNFESPLYSGSISTDNIISVISEIKLTDDSYQDGVEFQLVGGK